MTRASNALETMRSRAWKRKPLCDRRGNRIVRSGDKVFQIINAEHGAFPLYLGKGATEARTPQAADVIPRCVGAVAQICNRGQDTPSQ